jgi:uncharacterized protein (TIGR00730 family)
MKNLCVYCGSKSGNDPGFMASAVSLGRTMAKRNIDLVYGGASIGLMGQIADSVLAGGGSVTGVIPEALFKQEVVHTGLSELISVGSMHQRKQKMAELSDGFIALPGGFGTLEELFEAITWSQLRIHTKPIGLLNVDGYYDQLDRFIEHCVSSGFIKPEHKALYAIHSDPDTLIDLMDNLIVKP